MSERLIRWFLKDKQDLSQPHNRTAYGNFASVVGVLCNLLLFAGKLTVGTVFGSIAVTADAVNNLSDASGSIVSLIGFKLASRPADPEHPYGHARFEYLAGLTVSVMILVIGVELGRESLRKIFQPQPVQFGPVLAAVLIVSIAVKLWLAVFDRHIGALIHSETLITAAADSRNDVISTSAVLVSALLVHFTGAPVVDGVAGLLVALFILYSGVGLVRDAIDPILGCRPDPALVQLVQKKVMAYPGVLGIHDLMVHDYGPGQRFASLHVEMAAEGDVMRSHDIIDNIENDFLRNEHIMLTIHFDPIVTADPHVKELRDFLAKAAVEIDPSLTIHDVRIVPGVTHTNLLFDCVTPAGFAMPAAQIIHAFKQKVAAVWPDHICKIKMEISYTGAEAQKTQEHKS